MLYPNFERKNPAQLPSTSLRRKFSIIYVRHETAPIACEDTVFLPFFFSSELGSFLRGSVICRDTAGFGMRLNTSFALGPCTPSIRNRTLYQRRHGSDYTLAASDEWQFFLSINLRHVWELRHDEMGCLYALESVLNRTSSSRHSTSPCLMTPVGHWYNGDRLIGNLTQRIYLVHASPWAIFNRE